MMADRCCPCCGQLLLALERHGRQRDCIAALQRRRIELETLLRDCHSLFAAHSWGVEMACRIGQAFGVERPQVEEASHG